MTVWWLALSLVLVQGAAPSLADPGVRDVSARLAIPHSGPLQPARLAHDPGVDPRPVARPACEAGADGDSAALTARTRGGTWQVASTRVTTAPRPASSHDGAVWRVGFGWRAPPCGR